MHQKRQIRLDNWLLFVDETATHNYYAENKEICHCAYCQNFRMASYYVQPAVSVFYDRLGIDSTKPARLSALKVDNDKIMYTGSYTICGDIIEGEINGWDVTIGDHRYSLIEHEPGLIEIAFEVILPRMLEDDELK